MALNIRHDETERLAAELARLTGETKTEAVRKAVQARLERIKRRRAKGRLAAEFDRIARRCAVRPVLDARCAEAILGYDDRGLPA